MAIEANDESLERYKAFLLGNAAKGDIGDINDPRRVVLLEFAVLFEPPKGEGEDVPGPSFNLENSADRDRLTNEGITLPEGCKYKFKISFKVQHDVVHSLKLVHKVSKKVMSFMSEEDETMIGSFPPQSDPYTFYLPKWGYEEAPKGMMYRGKYKVNTSCVDKTKKKHFNLSYEINIVKD